MTGPVKTIHFLNKTGSLKMCTFCPYTIFPLFVQGDSS